MVAYVAAVRAVVAALPLAAQAIAVGAVATTATAVAGWGEVSRTVSRFFWPAATAASNGVGLTGVEVEGTTDVDAAAHAADLLAAFLAADKFSADYGMAARVAAVTAAATGCCFIAVVKAAVRSAAVGGAGAGTVFKSC